MSAQVATIYLGVCVCNAGHVGRWPRSAAKCNLGRHVTVIIGTGLLKADYETGIMIHCNWYVSHFSN